MKNPICLAFAALVAAAACHKQAPSTVAGALTASPAVRALGVDSYVLDSNGAELYKLGARIGRLSITADSSDSRVVFVSLDDGRHFDALVEGRGESGFRVALLDDVPVQAFQVDPALAPLFASYEMDFPPAQAGTADGLEGSNYNLCPGPLKTLNCRIYDCTVTNHSWSNITRLNTNGAACPSGTKIMPSTTGVSCPPGTSGNAGCYCGLESFVGTSLISCVPDPTKQCYPQNLCDNIQRIRTCTDPTGTCNISGGNSGCTSQLPLTGTCAQAGTYYSLSVTKSGTGSGTVTSDDGIINCGTTCSGNELSGNVVTLTATPSGYDTFTGWSGACTGTGTCTVTMTSAKSVTATFAACVPINPHTCGGDDGCGGCSSFNDCGTGFVCDTDGAGCYYCTNI